MTDGESGAQKDLWFWGVACSLTACFGTVSGLMLQKYSHMKNERLPPSEQRPSSRRPLWWASLFLMIVVPSPLDVASLALAPYTLLAPLAAVTLLLNALLSPCFLGETLTKIDKYATSLIFVGATLSTTFGNHSQDTYDVQGLYKLFSRADFIVFEIFSAACMLFLWLFIRRQLAEKKRWEQRQNSLRRSSITAGLDVLADAGAGGGGAGAGAGGAESFGSDKAAASRGTGLGIALGVGGDAREPQLDVDLNLSDGESDDGNGSAAHMRRASATSQTHIAVEVRGGGGADEEDERRKNRANKRKVSDGPDSSGHLYYADGKSAASHEDGGDDDDDDDDDDDMSASFVAGGGGDDMGVVGEAYNPDAKPPTGVVALPFAMGALAGLAGAQQNNLTKCFSELFFITVGGEKFGGHGNQFKYLLTWVVAVGAIFTAVFQISYVSKGLENCDAIFYLPVYNAFLIVLGVLSGAIFFDEIQNATVKRGLLFVLGVSITLAGVLVLTRRKPREANTKHPSPGVGDDGEDADLTLLSQEDQDQEEDEEGEQPRGVTASAVVGGGGRDRESPRRRSRGMPDLSMLRDPTEASPAPSPSSSSDRLRSD